MSPAPWLRPLPAQALELRELTPPYVPALSGPLDASHYGTTAEERAMQSNLEAQSSDGRRAGTPSGKCPFANLAGSAGAAPEPGARRAVDVVVGRRVGCVSSLFFLGGAGREST